MNPTNPNLLTFQSGPFMSEDNEESKAIVMALGLLNVLNTKKVSGNKKAKIALCGYHPTHWLILTVINGFDDEKENGYAVAGFPRPMFSKAEFAANAAIVCHRMLGTPEDAVMEIIDTKPEEN